MSESEDSTLIYFINLYSTQSESRVWVAVVEDEFSRVNLDPG